MLAPTSVMRPSNGVNVCTLPLLCSVVYTMSGDDKFTLDTLYSPQPGSSCLSYTVDYETTCPFACIKSTADLNSVSVKDHCCWCNGTLKHYGKAAYSPTTYLCQ